MTGSDFIPGWVMFGVERGPDAVCLYASKTLTKAELEAEVQEFSVWNWQEPIRQRTTFTITATMDNFVAIQATNWPSAFRALFSQWGPEGKPVAQIGDGVWEDT